jgi:hypothetical protein
MTAKSKGRYGLRLGSRQDGRVSMQSRRSDNVIASLSRDQAGAAVVTLALSLTGIAGLAGMGTEAANWYFTQRAMQGAADAAARTAAAAKSNGAGSDAYTTQAKSVAANFGFPAGTVTVHSPPSAGSHTADGNAIEVVISQSQTQFMSRMFMDNGPNIQARSVALANVSLTAPACVVALDTHNTTGLNTTGNPHLGFNGCSLYVNAAGTTAATVAGSAVINARAAYIAGSVNGAGLHTTDGTFTGVDPLKDPYASAPSPSAPSTTGSCGTGGANGNGLDKLFPNNQNTVTINPGNSGCTTYGFGGSHDLHMTAGQTLNLCPGVYVFDSTSLKMDGQSVLNAPPTATTTPAMSSALCGTNTTGGVTIIFTNSSGGSPGIPNIGAGATVNITAPSSGTYSGIALFEDRLACTGPGLNNNGCNPQMTGGGAQNITGAIYMPKATMNYQGNNSTGASAPPCTQLVAFNITFNGDSQFNNSCTTSGTATIGVIASQLVE